MKLFVWLCLVILVSRDTTNFPMDLPAGLAKLNFGAGLFDTLPEEINYPIFAKLLPQEKNKFRTTCKALSRFLSFYKPSELILHSDFLVAEKDITSIFITAVFDKDVFLVEQLCTRYGSANHNYYCKERKHRFVAINSSKFLLLNTENGFSISPYYVAGYNNDTAMIKVLDKSINPEIINLSARSENNLIESNVMPKDIELLIVSISRNADRIVWAINNISKIDDNDIPHWLAVIIDNDDSQSLAAIIHKKKIKKCIKKNSINLLNLAIFGHHHKVTELLIKSRLFNLNDITDHLIDETIHGWFFRGTYLDFINCCQECCKIDRSALTLLRKCGAKTTKELTLFEHCSLQ